ncbi:MAG: carboxypeptidase regulatory-like domain-containing protein [Candidatus Cloacimonetes bacterium]|jgi:hypothetical protein|nr:carboxypeptidase regulatory-like domain-containing protein [Candidatus Cloacimonadota bacterium]
MKKCLLKAMLVAMFMVVVAFAWGQSIFYEEPFDTNAGWTLEPNWSVTGGALQLSWSPSVTNYDMSATSADIVVPATAGDMVISQYINEYSGQGTNPPETYEIIALAGGTPTVLWTYSEDTSWGVAGGQDVTLSLAPFAGQTIQLKFRATGETTFNFNYWYIYDIKAYASLNMDLAAMSVTGELNPTMGTQYPYVVAVRNSGLTTVSNYSIKLMKTGDVEIGSVAGTAIAPLETISFTIPYTFTALGTLELWGKVVAAGDENPNNNETAHINVFVVAPGLVVAQVGEGTAVNTTSGVPAPYGTFYKNFREQYLVLASDLNDAGGGAGAINSIAFNVTAMNSCSAMPNYRIRIKTTTQTALSTTFETGAYTEVYQNASFLPALGWNIHGFSTPFVWDGAANLLIDVVTDIIPGAYAQNASSPYTVTGFNSSLRYQNDTTPAIDGTTGTVSANRTNMQFIMQPLDTVDMKAVAISGPTTPNVNSAINYTVSVKSYCPGTVSNYTVKLMKVGGVELASVPGTSINNMQTLEFTLPWTPTVVGETQLYGKVVMPGDLNPSNDETAMLTVVVMESGLLVAEIGNGTGTNTTTGGPAPYGTFYKAFRQQMLYTAADFYAAGGAPGLISALAFNVLDLDTCSPMPNFTIRVKHTDQEALSASFEAGDYTTVWHSDEYMPTAAWNLHNLIEPFFWDGASNLLVDISTDMIPGSWTHNALVALTPTSYPSSLRFQSDSANGSTGTTGSVLNSRSNIRFFMMLEDMGSLNGTVTAGGSPLEGAEIVVANTVFTALSGADGTYTLPHVPVGAQTVSATKHGYNLVTHNVTIVEDQASTQDFALALLPQVAVTGRIVGSDAPTLGIEGASITLSGYEAYTAITDATGHFSIPNVFTGHTYNYNATAIGYATTSGQLVVGTTPVNMNDIIVNEVAFPPHGVVATESANFQSVNVSWETPVPGGAGFDDDFESYADFATEFGDWTTIDVDGSATYAFSGIAFPGSGTAMSYIVFNPSMTVPPLDHPAHSGDKFLACFASTTPPNNDWLITPQVMGGGVASFWAKTYMDYGLERFKVGVSTTGTAPADFTIISGGTHVEAPLEWTEFTYDLSAYSGQQIYVGVQCISPDVFIFLVDDFYVGDARIRTASDAMQSSVAHTSNNRMGAIAERAIVTPNPVKTMSPAPRNTTRALMGYKVYRLLAADQANEANWTTLTTNTITPLQYADSAWGPLPSGVYKYAVKAVYTNNVMSPAAFSAELHKGMMGTLSGTVTEFGTDLPVSGATITAGEYSGTSTATGTYSFAVYAGTYEVTASKAGYQSASQTNVVIAGNQTTTQNFVLTEITLPPAAVEAVEAGANVNVTWMEPGTAGGEWLHYDSGENNDSIGTGGVADFDVAVRFPPSALTEYAGMSLHALKVWPAQAGTFTLKVWTGGTAAAPGALVVEQAFTPVLDTYNMVELNNPVTITGNEELWFGYNCNVSGGYPAGSDAGPADEGFGNMMFFNGVWDTLNNLSDGLDYNWNIQGYVGYGAPDRDGLMPLNAKMNIETHNAERALDGYKVWRLLQGQESNEAQWTTLTQNPISATAYQDNAWETLPDGTYKWAVKAVYTGGALSNSAFSNGLQRLTEIGTVAGFVRDMNNQPINGATITNGEYTANSNASGAYSMAIPAGTHSLVASHPNYTSMTQTGVIVVTGQITTVNFQLPASQIILEDGFESYPDFATSFAPWTLIDVDLSETYGLTNTAWLNAYAPQAYIIFNPSATVPPVTTAVPHGGNKFAASFAATTPPNNDWLITPQVAGGGEMKFWARTFHADYGLEEFKIGVSTTGTAPANFTIITGATAVLAPLEWTEFAYDLSAYAGQQVYVAIQCISNDHFIFMVDDVTISAGVGNENGVAPVYTTALKGNYPNPFNPETTISFSVKDAGPVSVEIYNVKGQLVKKLVNGVKEAGDHTAVWNGKDNNGRAVSSGVYYFKMNAGKYSSTKKMIMMK